MASNDVQSQIAALRDELDGIRQDLAERGSETYRTLRERAGEAAEAARPALRTARRYVRNEGTAVAQTARDHPAGLSALVIAAGLAGIAIGYLIGTLENEPPRRWHWR